MTTHKKSLYILNGPNLNMLGQRQPELYGHDTIQDIEQSCRILAEPYGISIEFRQTNHEGELIDWVQEASQKAGSLILNAASLTHTSVGLHDALQCLNIPIIEVHLTQPHQREPFRHTSYVSPSARGIISGFGSLSYKFATQAAIMLMSS